MCLAIYGMQTGQKTLIIRAPLAIRNSSSPDAHTWKLSSYEEKSHSCFFICIEFAKKESIKIYQIYYF